MFFIVLWIVNGFAAVPFSRFDTKQSHQQGYSINNNQNSGSLDFSNEQELLDPDNDRLKVEIKSSTQTDSGQSFLLSFSTMTLGYQDTSRSWLVVPDDNEYETYLQTVFNYLTAEDKERIKNEYLDAYNAWKDASNNPNSSPTEVERLKARVDELEGPHFNSYINSITYHKNNSKIYFPRSLTRNYLFDLDTTSIAQHAVSSWNNITDIYIPKEIEKIYKSSFENAPNTVTFHCEANSQPASYAEGWNYGANVEWGVDFQFLENNGEYHSRPLMIASAENYGRQDENYIIGWYPKEGEQKPLIAEYCLKGSTEVRYFEFSPYRIGRTFEAVGYQIGSISSSLICDIPLNLGEEIDVGTLILHNIFAAKKQGDFCITEPNYDEAYWFKPIVAFEEIYNLDQFCDISFRSCSEFIDYFTVDITIKSHIDEKIYQKLMAHSYRKYQSEINNGNVKVCAQLYINGGLTFKLKDNSSIMIPLNPELYLIDLNGSGTKQSFVFKKKDICDGFNVSDIETIDLTSFSINMRLKENDQTIDGTYCSTRFANLQLADSDQTIKTNNYNFTIAIFIIVLILSILLMPFILLFGIIIL